MLVVIWVRLLPNRFVRIAAVSHVVVAFVESRLRLIIASSPFPRRQFVARCR